MEKSGTTVHVNNSYKKIAIVVDTLHGGGAEKVCILLARALQKKQMKVYLIVVKPLCEYELEKDLPLYFLLDDSKARLHRKSVRQKATQALLKISAQAGGFDLILSNLDGAHPVVQAAGFANTWYVVHNSIEEKLKRAKRLGPFKYLRQKAVYTLFERQNLVAVSAGLRDELLQAKYVKPENVRLIYNPVDDAAISTTLRNEQYTLDEPYILHVGRFARLKRHDVLFDAYKQVISRPGTTLKLVLLCEQNPKLLRLIKKYQLEDHIILPGFQQNPYKWMKNARLLVLSSDGEGFGLVLVEAMLCGTPVVSTACQHGPSEILGEEFAEYLSPVGDTSELAKNIVKAFERKPVMSCAKILELVQPDYVAEQYLALLEVL